MAANRELAVGLGLTKREIKKIDALHDIMADLAEQQNWLHERVGLGKKELKRLRRVVRQLEYTMQMIWGFEEDKSKHYHWKRFNYLTED